MKGVIAEKQAAPYRIVDDLEVPEPSPAQILVRSIYTAINPIDDLMATMGFLVEEWPYVPGVDASGVVVKVGENAASRFKVGDAVCGCTRLGTKGHSTCQEYFLMDAPLTILKPENLSLAEAATIGVGVETASLGIFDGLGIRLLDPNNLPEAKDEWAVLLGGAGSVGKFGVQLFKLAGYKVIASCSPRSTQLVMDQGADAVFDYRETIENQVKALLSQTKGNVHCIFDAAATGDAFARALFEKLPQGPKLFATTSSGGDVPDVEGGRAYLIQLGWIGRPMATDLNTKLASYIPVLEALFKSGKLFPSQYTVVGEGGFQDVAPAIEEQKLGNTGARKIVVKLYDL